MISGMIFFKLMKNAVFEKTIIFKFWYDYMKPKYGKNFKLYYINTYVFIVYIKTEDIYVENRKQFEKVWYFKL